MQDANANSSTKPPLKASPQKTAKASTSLTVPLGPYTSAGDIASAIKQSLALVRQNGQVTKIGWSLQPVNLTMDEIVARVVTYQGAFSHTWTTWETCLELMRLGRIQTEPLLSEIWPITRWEEAFQVLEAMAARKILLYPVD